LRGILLSTVAVVLYVHTGGCFSLGDTSQLLPVGTPFVVRGTMTVTSEEGACLVWRAENGQSYFLYQDPLLDNDVYDRVIVPGATSRLVIATRSDLVAGCQVDGVAQVKEVLEIVP
jgi:hypothetical protein